MLSESNFIIQLLLAAVLGALIGIERELSDKPAGLRTHILVCVGATLFTTLAYTVADPSSPARILAGIVTGVGFLGGGAIIHARDDRVLGLTTAADIWVSAAIGAAVGMNYYYAAVVTTVCVLAILWLGRLIARLKKTHQARSDNQT